MPEAVDTDRSEAVAGLVDALAPLLVRRFREQLYAVMQPHCPIPLRDGTYPLLVALGQAPADASQVSAAVGVDRTVIIKQAALLEAAGLLERAPHPSRARIVEYQLTPAGHATDASLEHHLHEFISDASRNLTAEDLATTARVLTTLNTHLTGQPASTR